MLQITKSEAAANPRPGDRYEKRNRDLTWDQREVILNEFGQVTWARLGFGSPLVSFCSPLKSFRRWMRGATYLGRKRK